MCIAFAIGATRLGAQDKPIDGILHDARLITRSEATKQCPALVVRGPRPFANVSFDDVKDSSAVKTRCMVDTTYALPTADGVHWLAAIYRRVYVGPSDSISMATRHATRDTAVLITGALYSASNADDNWRPEWTGIVDESTARSIAPTLASRPDGSALVSVMYCVNGTGGCAQSYMRRRGGRWAAVVEAFWKQIPPIKDGMIGKGLGVDVRLLTGSYGLYGKRDANCCPSREILLELEQRGDSLLLKKYRLRRLEH